MSSWKFEDPTEAAFTESLGTDIIKIAQECHGNAVKHGFPLNEKLPQLVAFMDEVGEWCSAVRRGDEANELEEVVDITVRILAYMEEHFKDKWIIALKSKMDYNRRRPYLHNKRF